MTKFDVYTHPVRGYAAVKIGFSWPGLFFSFLWALVKRLWLLACVLLLADIVLPLIFQVVANLAGNISHFLLSNIVIVLALTAMYMAPLIVSIVVGFKGNGWVNADLITRGYRHLGRVESFSPDAAIASVVENRAYRSEVGGVVEGDKKSS